MIDEVNEWEGKSQTPFDKFLEEPLLREIRELNASSKQILKDALAKLKKNRN